MFGKAGQGEGDNILVLAGNLNIIRWLVGARVGTLVGRIKQVCNSVKTDSCAV
jgi:hypothetical protein